MNDTNRLYRVLNNDKIPRRGARHKKGNRKCEDEDGSVEAVVLFRIVIGGPAFLAKTAWVNGLPGIEEFARVVRELCYAASHCIQLCIILRTIPRGKGRSTHGGTSA